MIESEQLNEDSIWFIEKEEIMLDSVILGNEATNKVEKLKKYAST